MVQAWAAFQFLYDGGKGNARATLPGPAAGGFEGAAPSAPPGRDEGRWSMMRTWPPRDPCSRNLALGHRARRRTRRGFQLRPGTVARARSSTRARAEGPTPCRSAWLRRRPSRSDSNPRIDARLDVLVAQAAPDAPVPQPRLTSVPLAPGGPGSDVAMWRTMRKCSGP